MLQVQVSPGPGWAGFPLASLMALLERAASHANQPAQGSCCRSCGVWAGSARAQGGEDDPVEAHGTLLHLLLL